MLSSWCVFWKQHFSITTLNFRTIIIEYLLSLFCNCEVYLLNCESGERWELCLLGDDLQHYNCTEYHQVQTASNSLRSTVHSLVHTPGPSSLYLTLDSDKSVFTRAYISFTNLKREIISTCPFKVESKFYCEADLLSQ